MNATPDSQPRMEPIKPVQELFARTCHALWATTYNVDLNLFTEFLLPRLGDPPVNAVILADARRLAATLDRIPAERADSLATVNRTWLLRGMRFGGGAFHPKTYLAVTGARATLLVGSGNLSTGGLDDGRETFALFRSGTDVGDAAIRTWFEWMSRLVRHSDDVALAGRFADLTERLPASAKGPVDTQPPLLHNLDEPLLDQLLEQVTVPVTELHLAAPFYDPDGAAVERLIAGLQPERISVYTTGSTSVDGRRLASVLGASDATVRVLAYEPDRFTHAKLVGAVTGDDGWVLSGSANLSRAALTMTPPAGNIEMAALTFVDAEMVRDVLIPTGCETRELALADLEVLEFTPDPEPETLPVRLIRVTATANGRLEVVSDPPPEPTWRLDDLDRHHELTLDGDQTLTTQPVPDVRLVQLVDADGEPISNRAVVEDPAALDRALRESSTGSTSDRPPELHSGDLDSPVGRALGWLHRNLVMDVTETTGTGAAGAATTEEADSDNDDLWDRLEQEQLGRDPRTATYRKLWRTGGDAPGSQPLIELLEAMRDQLPTPDGTPSIGHDRSPVLSLLDRLQQGENQGDGENEEGNGDGGKKSTWKPETRIRVRARNVLHRWAAAQSDPKLMWVDPLAPAGNFAMVTWTLAQIWVDRLSYPGQVELTDDDLTDLWFRWLRTFVGTGEGDGWLDHVDEDDAIDVRARLDGRQVSEIAPLLCHLALQPRPTPPYREVMIRWQPVVSAADDHGLLKPSAATAHVLATASGSPVALGGIEDRLTRCIEYIDDELWCQRIADRLDIPHVSIEAAPKAVGVRLDIAGVGDPLVDPRMPQLIVAAQQYHRCDGVAIYSTDEDWRIVAIPADKLVWLPGVKGDMRESSETLTSKMLQDLTARGGVISDLLDFEAVA